MTNATVTAENSAITTTENKEQIATFLKEHEEVEMIIPVMFGLFVTSQFQLRGAKALLVNLGVATVFRQLFKELKKVLLKIHNHRRHKIKPMFLRMRRKCRFFTLLKAELDCVFPK